MLDDYNSGHIGYNAALPLLKQRVYWVGMANDMQLLCSACLHCMTTSKGFRIPRPLGEACHGTKRNMFGRGVILHIINTNGYLY
jgi:hypothetical protein